MSCFKYVMMDERGDWQAFTSKREMLNYFYANNWDWLESHADTMDFDEYQDQFKEMLRQMKIDMPVFKLEKIKDKDLPWAKVPNYLLEELKEKKNDIEQYEEEEKEEIKNLKQMAKRLGFKLVPKQ